MAAVINGHTHAGLQLLSNNEIQVDVTGDLQLVDDQLILDLSFAGSPSGSVPEPATLALLGASLAGFIALRGRRKRRAD